MATFTFSELIQGDDIVAVSAQLGTGENYASPYDVGKPVKMGTSSNYVLCAAGDEIEGFVEVVEDRKVNGGKSFGTVTRNGRRIVEVGPDGASNAVSVLDYVVADAQSAIGTYGTPKVKKGVPTVHKWRVITIISGTGGSGTKVLIERAA